MGSSATKYTLHCDERRTVKDSHEMDFTFRLHNAVNQNNFKEARKMIANGANVNCINYRGGTPLLETCRSNKLSKVEKDRISFVRFLIANGSDVNKSDINGWTALLYAEENGHDKIEKVLERIEYRRSQIEKRVDEKYILTVSELGIEMF